MRGEPFFRRMIYPRRRSILSSAPRPFGDTYRPGRDRRSDGKCVSVQVPSSVYKVIRSLTPCPTVDQNSNRIKTSDRHNGLSSRTRYSDYLLCACTSTPSHETLSKRNSYGSAVESVISRWLRGYRPTRPTTLTRILKQLNSDIGPLKDIIY